MTERRPTFSSAVDVIGGRTGEIIRKIHFFILCRTYVLFCQCICTATNCGTSYLLEGWRVGQFVNFFWVFFPVCYTGYCIKVAGKHSCCVGVSGLHQVTAAAALRYVLLFCIWGANRVC